MSQLAAADGQVILPNMTSSKSFRATIFSSSLSLSSLRSRSHSDASTKSKSKPASNTNNTLRKTKPKPSLDPPRLQSQSPAAPPAEETQADETQADETQAEYQTEAPAQQPHEQNPESPAEQRPDVGKPVPPKLLPSRSRTWSDRFSSIFPSLTSPTADARPLSILRKPVALVPPAEAPPPPPYKLNESTNTSASDAGERTTPDAEQRHRQQQRSDPQLVCPQYSPPIPPSALIDAAFDTQKLDIPLTGFLKPQIMDPIPPSPDPNRTIFDIPEQTPDPGMLNPNLVEDDDDLHNQEVQQQRPNFHQERPRSTSFGQRKDSLPALGLKTRQTAPLPEARGRSVSARVPSTPVEETAGSRVVSSPVPSRPISVASQSPSRRKLRRSWMPGGRSRSNSAETSKGSMTAWVMSEGSNVEYNTAFLKNGEKVPELWNEVGTVLVYLYPKSSSCGPSFKVPEFTVSTSLIFNELIRSEMDASAGLRSRTASLSLNIEDASRLGSMPPSPASDYYSGDLRLYLPLAPAEEGAEIEMDRLIAMRNLFAFLTGQPLVGTKSHPTMFQTFLQIANLLEEFCFSSQDGYTFGNAVDLSFEFYSDQLGLADCRHSRGKTLEALILGERMRSMSLYNEAFAHSAGKYSAIMDLGLPLFNDVSLHTRQRLERAHLDLVNRQHNANVHLEQFEFPSLFAGLANSTSIPELKVIRFKVWKNSFSKMRQFVIGYYKSTFGSWPPKASNKKNPFAESGLNRLVLKALYSDMCALYDLIVDRNNLTSRVMDEVPAISDVADKMTTSALRVILSEFDRSKPPVLPPIPFDLPQLPSMTSLLATYYTLSAKEQSRFDKKIKEHELTLVLSKSYNSDTNSLKVPFLEQFKAFEAREARGKVAQDLMDQRVGYWIFLYTVLQSLPVLVVDAPDLKFTEGVEYFLCEPPMGNPPWVDDRQVRKMWYEVAGGGGIVELSADAVMFSVEATYHRSHCWLAAKMWEDVNEEDTPPLPLEDPGLPPLEPPRPMFQGSDSFAAPAPSGHSTPSPPPGSPQVAIRPRNFSPARSRASSAYRSSIMMGLEPLPLDPPPSIFGVHQRSSSLGPRPQSSYLGNRNGSTTNLVGMGMRDSRPSSPAPAVPMGATFDDILGEPEQKKPMAKKKSRFF